MKISNELRWCRGFARAVILRGHYKHRVRLKNTHKVERMKKKAFRRWGCFPFPPEWKRGINNE